MDVDRPDYGKPCEGFFEGEMTLVLEAQPDGTLKGTANGDPIASGYGFPNFAYGRKIG